MRGLLTATILLLAETLSASDFVEIDALMRRDAAAKIALAEETAKFAEETANLDAEIAAADTLIAQLNDRVAKLGDKIARSKKNTEAVESKIKRDESALARISETLDTLYAELSAALARTNSGVATISPLEFSKKSANEKFREFASVYARAFAADKSYSKKDDTVHTGLFVVGSGEGTDIAKIKVVKTEAKK